MLKVVLSNGAIATAERSDRVQTIEGHPVYRWVVSCISSAGILTVSDLNGEGEFGINLNTLRGWGERQFAADPMSHILQEAIANLGDPAIANLVLETCFDMEYEKID